MEVEKKLRGEEGKRRRSKEKKKWRGEEVKRRRIRSGKEVKRRRRTRRW
jgi:hypothetical protein